MSYLPEDVETDEDTSVDGGDAPCCECGKTHVRLYHSWNDFEGDLWKCAECSAGVRIKHQH